MVPAGLISLSKGSQAPPCRALGLPHKAVQGSLFFLDSSAASPEGYLSLGAHRVVVVVVAVLTAVVVTAVIAAMGAS